MRNAVIFIPILWIQIESSRGKSYFTLSKFGIGQFLTNARKDVVRFDRRRIGWFGLGVVLQDTFWWQPSKITGYKSIFFSFFYKRSYLLQIEYKFSWLYLYL